MEILPFEPGDLEQLDGLQPTDWAPIRPHYEYYLAQSMCHPFKAVQDGLLVGVSNASVFGSSAWLSHVIVRPDCRGQGIGGALVGFLLALVDRQAVRTTSLIATDFGYPVYLKHGFAEEVRYVFTEKASPTGITTGAGNFRAIPPSSGGIRDSRPGDGAAILAIDAEVSGEERSRLLAPHLAKALVHETGGHIDGFFLPELGSGLVMALNPATGRSLLGLLVRREAKIVLPESNQASREFLAAQGYHETKNAWRMVRGPRLDWRPDCLHARIGGNFG